jgi:hypothetical protein
VLARVRNNLLVTRQPIEDLDLSVRSSGMGRGANAVFRPYAYSDTREMPPLCAVEPELQFKAAAVPTLAQIASGLGAPATVPEDLIE